MSPIVATTERPFRFALTTIGLIPFFAHQRQFRERRSESREHRLVVSETDADPQPRLTHGHAWRPDGWHEVAATREFLGPIDGPLRFADQKRNDLARGAPRVPSLSGQPCAQFRGVGQQSLAALRFLLQDFQRGAGGGTCRWCRRRGEDVRAERGSLASSSGSGHRRQIRPRSPTPSIACLRARARPARRRNARPRHDRSRRTRPSHAPRRPAPAHRGTGPTRSARPTAPDRHPC